MKSTDSRVVWKVNTNGKKSKPGQFRGEKATLFSSFLPLFACSLLQLSWWHGFMLKLLLRLTVIAKAGGGLLPTHQAGVGGDVCPLRVCSEAEDKRRRTATLGALAVPGIALSSCATWRLWPARHLRSTVRT